MEADVFPAYGHKSINEVAAADVRQLMIAVEKRDARDVAKRIHETTSQIFRFAIARDIATRNPAADFKPRDILAEGLLASIEGCFRIAGHPPGYLIRLRNIQRKPFAGVCLPMSGETE